MSARIEYCTYSCSLRASSCLYYSRDLTPWGGGREDPYRFERFWQGRERKLRVSRQDEHGLQQLGVRHLNPALLCPEPEAAIAEVMSSTLCSVELVPGSKTGASTVAAQLSAGVPVCGGHVPEVVNAARA